MLEFLRKVDEKKVMTSFVNLSRGSQTVFQKTSKIYPPVDPKEVNTDVIDPELVESIAFKSIEEDLVALAHATM